MKRLLSITAIALIAGTFAAKADQTGLHVIHDLGKEHGKLCMTGHFHDGTGNGQTRKAAEAAAIKSWADFVILEYGTDWGHHAYAGSRSMTCKKSSGFWNCDTSARPCLRQSGAATSPMEKKARVHRVKTQKKSS